MKKTRRIRPPHDRGGALLAALFLPLACAMYYFHDASIWVGGIHLMYKFALAAVLTALSFVVFLVRTDLERGWWVLRGVALLSLPHLVIPLASVPVWVSQVQRLALMRRGVFDQIYGLFMLLAIGGLFYVFGQRGFWLNLAAMLAANLITVVRVISENGFSVYFQELRTLVATFAGETGPVIQQMEIHELTFGLGVCLLFGVLNWKEFRRHPEGPVFLALTAFCFLSGFKRIGIVAMGAAFALWILLRPLCGKHASPLWVMLAAFAGIAAAFLYICMVKGGIFEFLSARFGLNTMGRRELSRFIDEYYWIGPDFLGNGAGFVTRMFSDLPEEYTIRALHNDILLVYIDIGFWGFWVWMLCYLPLRVWVIYRWHGLRSALLCLCLETFVLATAATDNTLYYIYVTGAVAACLMSDWMGEGEPCLS